MPPFASGLRGKVPPFDPRIVRHYEDAAAIILNLEKCHPLSIKNGKYEKLFIELMERRMVRRKVEAGTIIHNDESLYLTDKLKLESLQTCQQQRTCLYYQIKKEKREEHYSERSNDYPNPPLLEDCALIIREWVAKVGL